jgi:predicted DsbA family dithiol-disulfide isomerase/uncharacterized membrane protein
MSRRTGNAPHPAAVPWLMQAIQRIRSPGAVALAVSGLALSAALLVDSLRPAPAFCAAGGCAEVRSSAWAHPLGIPMPVFGLAFFACAALLASAGGGWRVDRARRIAAALGGAGALTLLAVQGLAIGAWCRLCVATDLVALAHAVLVLSGRTAWPPIGRARAALTAAAAIAAIAVPLGALTGEPRVPAIAAPAAGSLPEVIAREQVAGTAVVVDFVDFECPFCRAFHAELTTALASAAVPVRVVRKMVPLPQHRGAFPAALAWCCADAQGKGDEMADRLFASTDFSTDGLERLAAEIGLDLERFRADAADPATRARIEEDGAAAAHAGVSSLPTVYIGGQRFVGAGASVDQLVAALRDAAAS